MKLKSHKVLQPEADELVLFERSHCVGDTYIFEPAAAEEKLGRLYVAAETEDRDDLGSELLDTFVHAIQREYYRDPARGVLVSFESALHQANLVLYDIAEQHMREWMGSLHVAVGVLAGTKLHVSTAGEGVVMMARRHRVTVVSAGLSHSPITDPLRTFSQVASGVVSQRDVLFFATSQFQSLFRREDLARFVVDHSAATIALRLQQLYQDQRKDLSVAALVVSILPEHVVRADKRTASDDTKQRAPVTTTPGLVPRKPLTIERSSIKRVTILSGRVLVYMWQRFRQILWPLVIRGSRRGGQALFKASQSAGHNVRYFTERQIEQWKKQRKQPSDATADLSPSSGNYSLVSKLKPRRFSLAQVQSWPRRMMASSLSGLKSLPISSKVFAVVAIVLALALTTSVVLLQKKRAADIQFEKSSELLHEARTKKEAADTALIYDNRDQARNLIRDAQSLVEELNLSGLYQEQTQELQSAITIVQDRLDKVTRVAGDTLLLVGDFGSVITRETPTRLFYLQDNLYTYDTADNKIAKMNKEGEVSVVSQTTQGIGFFTQGTVHEADKALVLVTDSPGLALYDAKTEVLQKQEITLPTDESEITSIATYGNRIYLYDRTTHNIYGYNKTLRGYSGGDAWLNDDSFNSETIRSIGVDGYIYTLHNDGTIQKLLKGSPVEFSLERLEPAISDTARLLITENLRYLYVFDPANSRVVIFDTTGNLSRQIYLGDDSTAVDIAVDSKETTLYVLDGTQVSAISLSES